MMECRI